MKTIKELQIEIETTRANLRHRHPSVHWEVWNLARKTKLIEFRKRNEALRFQELYNSEEPLRIVCKM